jgi:ubiquitin-activating enzyme E1
VPHFSLCTAKNIILAGVKSVVLMDDTAATWMDLSTQFYVRESEIGQTRGAVSIPRLAELNPYVSIRHETGTLASKPESFFYEFQAVVLASPSTLDAIRINDICHAKGIPFVMVQARGFVGSLFVDCGPAFEVNDRNGEEPVECMISEVTQGNPGVVKTIAGRRHGLDDGDHVRFSEVQGMVELNGNEFPIKVLDSYSFSIGDTSALSPYLGGGLATEVKVPSLVAFRDLKSSLKQPEISFLDFGKMESPIQTHIGLAAVLTFRDRHGRFPAPWSEQDAVAVLEFAREFALTLSESVRWRLTILSEALV